jgi:hypothetical protein
MSRRVHSRLAGGHGSQHHYEQAAASRLDDDAASLMMVVRLDDDAAILAHPFTLVFAVMPLVSDSYGMCVLIHGVFVHADTPVCTDIRRVSDIRGVY